MTAFDPTEAAESYLTLDTEELVRIAYLEPDYLPEAKAIALRELDRRRIPRNNAELIDRVRADIAFRRDSAEMLMYDNFAKADRLERRIGAVILTGALWVFALIAPAYLRDVESLSIDWKVVTLSLIWLLAAIFATRKRSRGEPLLFYVVVVVPAALFILGSAYQFYK